jgi:hypothetical protein
MANEFQLLPNPTNIPEAVSTGYQRQNTNIFVLQTGLDTTDPHLTNNGNTISISAGGMVESNGSLFELKSDVTISIPNVNNDYFIFIHDNGDKTANIDISPDYPTFNHSKNGWYTTNNERVLRSFYMRKILVKRDSNNENIDPVTFIDLKHTTILRLSLENLLSGRAYLVAATLGDGSVLFAGGRAGYPTLYAYAVVDKYDTNGIRTTFVGLSVARYNLAAATLGDGSVLFGGGANQTSSETNSEVDKLDIDGVRTTFVGLSVARYNLVAATLGDGSVLFAGGHGATTEIYDTVDKYDTNGIRTTLTPLSVARSYLAAATLGDGSVLFGGGSSSNFFAIVDKYDIYGVRTTLTSLSVARSRLAAATLGNGSVLFGGGQGSASYDYYGYVNMYNYSTALDLSYSSKYRFEDDTAEQTGVTQVIKKTPIKGYVRQ